MHKSRESIDQQQKTQMKQTKITLEEAEEVITEFPEQSYFVDAYFQQGLGGHFTPMHPFFWERSKYWDNSMKLAAYWTKCKQIIDNQ